MSTQATPTESTEPATKGGGKLWRTIILVVVVALASFLTYEYTRPRETEFTNAVKMIKQGRAAAAIPVLERLTHEDPDNSNVYPWLAQGYLACERYAEGRTSLDTALRLKLSAEELSPVIQAFAEYYQRRGDYEEAEKLYQSVMKRHSGKSFDVGRAKLYMAWAEQEIAADNLNDAVYHLQQADKLAKDLDSTITQTVPLRLSDCYRKLAAIAETQEKDDKEAIRLLEQSLSVCDEPITRILLAAIYARTGQSGKAIENYEFVSSQDPNNLEVRHRLIELLLEKKDYEKAQVALSELTDKERSVEDYELLADVNIKIANYAGAVRALEEASTLRQSVPLLEKLKSTLLAWSDQLASQKKNQEAISVKGHAARVSEQLVALRGEDPAVEEKLDDANKTGNWDPNKPPISIVFSRNWLAKDSLTPEGKIKIRNITGAPITDLTLSAVFFDNTMRKRNGSVLLPVASPSSPPFEPDGERWLYFSCPQTVKYDHQLAVVLLWKGKLLKEFPVTKR
ncbi:tetratricopeptide repeat protein [Candidatus Obscuribacterales bacterium]|nr:tetratricopeptide repeat protein [Candidatus Obscuribacterales bacterium]MBX3134857.1 tetratricopeptide repeat protein [Candidatus Obscuribacterales bacterium]MBX3154008.1 tetratricopeptide repeat protein [Candidatus Obscuribacterales bacterium]